MRFAMATQAKDELTPQEFIASVWARNALPFHLIDEPMFRKQFGVAIPLGFDRHKLSSQMHSLAAKLDNCILAKVTFCFF